MRVLFPSTLPNVNQAPDYMDGAYVQPQQWEVFLEPSGFSRTPSMNESCLIQPSSRPGMGGRTGTAARRRMRVLHVEDTPEIRLITRIFLKDEFDVVSAANGEEAFQKAKSGEFDIILMDINLGEGMSGFETSSKIRELQAYNNVPIIAVTTSNYLEVRSLCIESGVNAFVQKPFEKRDLKATINQLIKFAS